VDGDAMFKDASPENKRRDLLIYRLTMKVRGPLKQELADGKFNDWPAVEAAGRQRIASASAADPDFLAADKAWKEARQHRLDALPPRATTRAAGRAAQTQPAAVGH
jgi:hypothetical protein